MQLLIVFDMTNTNTFDNVINWISEANEYNLNDKASIIICGNKVSIVYINGVLL